MYIPYETHAFKPATTVAFTPYPVPKTGAMPVPHARMKWAATTVGAVPVGLGGIRRPQVEATWRSAMVEATLQQTSSGRRWTKTPAYERLDGSEKSAVSYFHGMVGARLLTEHLLHIPHLVHLDAVLKQMKQPLKGSRPDFIGHHPLTNTYSMPLEAKGRSGAWAGSPLVKAKIQAGLLPSVVGTTTKICAASLTYFEDDHWTAYMEDPPMRQAQSSPIPPGLVTAFYYLPIVHALATLNERDRDSGPSGVTGALPEAGSSIALPGFIFDPIAELPFDLEVELDQIKDAGDRIRSQWAEASAPTPSLAAFVDGEAGQSQYAEFERSWTGLDLVTVSVDRLWSERAARPD